MMGLESYLGFVYWMVGVNLEYLQVHNSPVFCLLGLEDLGAKNIGFPPFLPFRHDENLGSLSSLKLIRPY